MKKYSIAEIMVVFGWPTEHQLQRTKPARCPLELVVQQNTYHPLTPDQLRQMTASRGAQDFAAWTRAFCARKYNSAFSAEMNRSVSLYLKKFL